MAPSVVEGVLGDSPPTDGPPSLSLEIGISFLLAASLVVSAASTSGAAKLVFKRRIRTFVAPAASFRWRLLLMGFSVYAILALATFSVDAVITSTPLAGPVLDQAYSPLDRLVYAGSIALLTLAVASAEEIEHRGIVLQLTAAYTRSLPILLIVNGLIFSAAHLEFDPPIFIERTAVGGMYAWIVLRSAGLELAIGAHAANNLIATFLFNPPAGSTEATSALEPAYAVVNIGICAAFLLFVVLLLRLRFVQDWTAARIDADDTHALSDQVRQPVGGPG